MNSISVIVGSFAPSFSFSLAAAVPPRPLPELQRDLVNLPFGMFIHCSPTTYLET